MLVTQERRWAALAAAAFAVAAGLGARVERTLVVEPTDGMAVYGQSSDDEGENTSNGASQRLRQAGDAYVAAYQFKSFNGDRISVEYRLGKDAWRQYEGAFGYYKKDVKAIDDWLNTARQGAYKFAVSSGKSQAQLNAALANLDKERDRKIKEYLAAKGFKMLPGNVVTIDMPSVVRRNAPVLNSVAGALDAVAQKRRYDSLAIAGAGASLVQTAMIYKIPPTVDPDGRHTGGIMQPATALIRGWGDCDTKTALLSSILANWPQMRMVGVAVPSHYLMAVLTIPNKGDVFVEHDGLQYALIEPAGPAWLQPGQVAQSTVNLLQQSEGYRIDPFF